MSIEIKGLSKKFGNTEVLTDFNSVLKKGHITCIMGSSGCGKTTFLNILMGIMKADSGTIQGVDGKSISVVFQENRLCEGFSSIDNILLVCDKQVDRKTIEDSFEQVGLEDVINKTVCKLSGGMKRRVAILRAIHANKEILIMDEPFKGLDLDTKEKVIEYIENKVLGKTIIITTHNKEDVEMLKATLVIM